jgi:hypothetical protein
MDAQVRDLDALNAGKLMFNPKSGKFDKLAVSKPDAPKERKEG